MTPARALHTAARRYCIERADAWRLRYYDERERREAEGRYPPGAYSYVPEDYAVFPRYNVLDAILWEVERIEPDDATALERMRELLVAAGRIAESPFTRPPNEPAATIAMNEERDQFCAYVTALSEPGLDAIEPLPYRRVLGVAESARLWSALAERWDVTGHFWYPIELAELPPDVVPFDAQWFYKCVPAEILQGIVAHRQITRLWELREGGSVESGQPEYEIDLALFEPNYDGREGYRTSGEMDWLIYDSHEGSITVAGEWLVTAVQAAWPAWQDYLYIWDHVPPPPGSDGEDRPETSTSPCC